MDYLVQRCLEIQLLAIDLFASIYSGLRMISIQIIICYRLEKAAWLYLGYRWSQLWIFLNALGDEVLNLLAKAAPLIFGEV